VEKNQLGVYTRRRGRTPVVPAEPKEINCRLIYVSRPHFCAHVYRRVYRGRDGVKKNKIEKKNIREDTENKRVNPGQLAAHGTHARQTHTHTRVSHFGG